MKRLKLLAVAALVAISAGSAVFVVSVKGAETTDIPVEYFTKQILACQDPTLDDTGEVMDRSYECLKEIISTAIFNKSFPNFVKAADPIMARDIKLEYVCHIPAHDIGRQVVEFYDSNWREAILALGYDLCGSGFVHGVYDVWGLEQHTDAEWVEIGSYCEEAVKIRYNACGDAIGHSAYESAGQDLEKAMMICNLQKSNLVSIPCSNGAYMQANFPQSTKLKKAREVVLEPSENWSDFVTFCDRVPFTNPGAREGCYYGAGWVIGNTIFFELQKVRPADNDEFSSTPEMDAKVLELISYAIDACESGAMNVKEIKYGCSYIMLARMPLFYYMNQEKFIDFCEKSVARFPEESGMLLECLASGHEHITPESMRALVDTYPGLDKVMTRRGLPIPTPDGGTNNGNS